MPNYLTKRRTSYRGARRIAYNKARGKCRYCRRKVPWKEYEAHHAVPRFLGGNDNPANLEVYHRSCHREFHKKEKKLWGASLENKIKGWFTWLICLF